MEYLRVFDKQMHLIRVYYHINNPNIKFLTGLPDYRFRQHSYIANQHLASVLGKKTMWSVSSDTVCLSCLNSFDIRIVDAAEV